MLSARAYPNYDPEMPNIWAAWAPERRIQAQRRVAKNVGLIHEGPIIHGGFHQYWGGRHCTNVHHRRQGGRGAGRSNVLLTQVGCKNKKNRP